MFRFALGNTNLTCRNISINLDLELIGTTQRKLFRELIAIAQDFSGFVNKQDSRILTNSAITLFQRESIDKKPER